MYELCKVIGNTHYINSPSKIGLYVDGTDAYLIDSGNDKDAGKKVKKILDDNGWNLNCIINTHSHADHIGGNNYLQKQTGCRIYAKGIENVFTLFPILEPSFLSGSYPSKNLLHKFLYADKSVCDDISNIVLPAGFEIIDLPGHSFDMIGIRTPDNVLFIADSLSSKATLEKYGVGYNYDISGCISTFDKLLDINAQMFIPSHADASKDINELVEYNKTKILETACFIVSALSEHKTFEDLLCVVFEKYNLTMTNEQYVLIGSTVKSYLSYLKDSGKIESYFENNKIYWKQI